MNWIDVQKEKPPKKIEVLLAIFLEETGGWIYSLGKRATGTWYIVKPVEENCSDSICFSYSVKAWVPLDDFPAPKFS